LQKGFLQGGGKIRAVTTAFKNQQRLVPTLPGYCGRGGKDGTRPEVKNTEEGTQGKRRRKQCFSAGPHRRHFRTHVVHGKSRHHDQWRLGPLGKGSQAANGGRAGLDQPSGVAMGGGKGDSNSLWSIRRREFQISLHISGHGAHRTP